MPGMTEALRQLKAELARLLPKAKAGTKLASDLAKLVSDVSAFAGRVGGHIDPLEAMELMGFVGRAANLKMRIMKVV